MKNKKLSTGTTTTTILKDLKTPKTVYKENTVIYNKYTVYSNEQLKDLYKKKNKEMEIYTFNYALGRSQAQSELCFIQAELIKRGIYDNLL